MIVSNLLAPEVVLSNSSKRLGFLRQQCSVFQLRLVSHRFQALVDGLLEKNFPEAIWLVGAYQSQTARGWREDAQNTLYSLRMILSPLLRSRKPFSMKVHLLPELTSMRAEVNWDVSYQPPNPENVTQRPMKDDYTAAMAMAAHQASAIVLSQMLRKVFDEYDDATQRCDVHVIFYEIDGSSLDASAFMAGRAQPQPAVLPFWELDSVETILRHWRWIGQHHPFRSFGHYVTLPVIAMTTETAMSAEYASELCSRRLSGVWGSGYPWIQEYSPTITRRWVPRMISGPSMHMFSLWLTTLCPRWISVRCFAVRAASMNGVRQSRALLLERPSSLVNVA
ncbi:hypothetical protein A1O1_00887 [Capronia coronata CBS 617.96]|uniref:Uncharacterized protein n=1 Tax=Capronia coronata CBS 617.96 TaxID=1182541 RepID=W9YT85_9EURO|nr:uncharacterized protein A1O1_00887 [Capronia coronata CBS 617.96]EXJ95763.1 hypothetical protein A1O1_00887 [Capronia coronata CBS 617.96]